MAKYKEHSLSSLDITERLVAVRTNMERSCIQAEFSLINSVLIKLKDIEIDHRSLNKPSDSTYYLSSK